MKTVFMVINHPRRQNTLPELPSFYLNNTRIPSIYLNNTRIKLVHKTKYLGLTVDDSLNWNEQ